MRILARKPLAAVSCGFALALLVMPAHAARAQTPAPTPQAQQQEGPPAQANPNDPVSLLGQLNLSQDQITQMRSIQGESVPQAQALTRRLNQARRALDEAIYSDAVDEALIEQRARDVADAQAALVRLRAQTELRVRRVLTAEQLQTFRGLRIQARREQRIERQLDRGVNPQRPGRNALEANPNKANNPNRAVQRPNAPAAQPPKERPLQQQRERRHNFLGRP